MDYEVIIIGECPVDLEVRDPDGLTITKTLIGVLNGNYLEFDINDDDDLDDIILIPDRKIGDYTITVIPDPTADPADTFSLKVSASGTTIFLAEDVPISDIPAQPYVIESTDTGIVEKTPQQPPEPIPEFATIAIPVAVIIGLFVLFCRRKER